jgi:DNA-directed RNA polymerase specialized sigma subunit
MSKHEVYVKALLEYRAELSESRDRGNYALVDELADLENAVGVANLTDKQREALRLYYGEVRTEREVAYILGVYQRAVSKSLDAAVGKIAKVYENWEALESET